MRRAGGDRRPLVWNLRFLRRIRLRCRRWRRLWSRRAGLATRQRDGRLRLLRCASRVGDGAKTLGALERAVDTGGVHLVIVLAVQRRFERRLHGYELLVLREQTVHVV